MGQVTQSQHVQESDSCMDDAGHSDESDMAQSGDSACGEIDGLSTLSSLLYQVRVCSIFSSPSEHQRSSS